MNTSDNDYSKEQKLIQVESLAFFTKVKNELTIGRWAGYNAVKERSEAAAHITYKEDANLHYISFMFYLKDVPVFVYLYYDIRVGHPSLGNQRTSICINKQSFSSQICPEFEEKLKLLVNDGFVDSSMSVNLMSLCNLSVPREKDIWAVLQILDTIDSVNR